MPRGYLKHNKAVGSKRSRGGGSRRSTARSQLKEHPGGWRDRASLVTDDVFEQVYENDYYYLDYEEDICDESDEEEEILQKDASMHSLIETFVNVPEADSQSEDFVNVHDDAMISLASDDFVAINQGKDDASSLADSVNSIPSECCICLKQRQVVKLMKRCKHPSACYDCLRQCYVIQAQKDISYYPLMCFYPVCNRRLHDEQVKRLVKSQDELERHYRMSILGKAKNGSRVVVHCPKCDHPRYIATTLRFNNGNLRVATCLKCNVKYAVEEQGLTTDASTIRVLESLKRDSVGPNNGWARCPSCRIIISKGGGCDYMVCACGHFFLWSDAVRRTKKSALPTAPIREL